VAAAVVAVAAVAGAVAGVLMAGALARPRVGARVAVAVAAVVRDVIVEPGRRAHAGAARIIRVLGLVARPAQVLGLAEALG
jgi:hypothetical protein